MIGLDLLAAHLIGDFILQSHRVAQEKLTNTWVRIEHVSLYILPFAAVAGFHATSRVRFTVFIALTWLTHFIIDSRRWVSGEEWPPKPIVVDQTIHLASLTILARLL